MRRRIVSLLGVAGLMLLLPASLVLADVGPGLSLQTASEARCNGNLCAEAFVSAHVNPSGTSQVCLTIIYTNSELGGAEYDRETGCADDPGTLIFAKGNLLVGFTATSITLTSQEIGGTRSATVASSHKLTSAVERTTDNEVSNDVPDPGCTTTETWKTRHATVGGSVTIDGDTLSDSGDTWDIALVKTRVRC